MSSPIHLSVLVPSLHDTIALGQAVEERFADLLNLYLRMKGEHLVPPPSLDSDMLLWRTMRQRHNKTDFRNTRDELLATRRVADWTLSQKCTLVGKPYQKIEWKD